MWLCSIFWNPKNQIWGLVGKVQSPDFWKFKDTDTNIGHVQTCLFLHRHGKIFDVELEGKSRPSLEMSSTCRWHVLMLARCQKILKLTWMSTTRRNFLFWVTCLWHVVVTNWKVTVDLLAKIYLQRKYFLTHKRYHI